MPKHLHFKFDPNQEQQTNGARSIVRAGISMSWG